MMAGLFLGIMPVTPAASERANTFDDASATPIVTRDRTGGGWVVAHARASKTTGIMAATATATSDSPAGSPYLLQPLVGGIGGNQAKSISALTKYFDLPEVATYAVTVSVTVSEPLAATAHMPSPNFANDLTQALTGGPGPYLGTYASSYVTLGLSVYFADNVAGGDTKYRYRHPYTQDTDQDVLTVGTHLLDAVIDGAGMLVVRVHLEVAATATGDDSLAGAFCNMVVGYIEVT